MKVVLSPNPYRDNGLKTTLAARDILAGAGIETVFALPFSAGSSRKREESHHGIAFRNLDEVLAGADMLICLGGDGTLLHAAKHAVRHQIPILGINIGSVGFMTELERGDLKLLPRLAAGDYRIEARMMLDVSVRRGGQVLYHGLALNDAVITKGAVARVIDLSVSGDGVLISEFSGDGVIVCTPTGSTGYSMSAGGPIVEPTAENIIVTPICAHSLQAKSMVLDRNRTVCVRTDHQNHKTAYLSVDGGKAFRLCGGDRVEIFRSAAYTSLARLTEKSFYRIVHQKLGKV
ncbi:MAG: NAD(+)/NADH kinase [Clostridiales bacterium]|nr:NAD(+)/NADH kinase [Clostridiales bacterium]